MAGVECSLIKSISMSMFDKVYLSWDDKVCYWQKNSILFMHLHSASSQCTSQPLETLHARWHSEFRYD